MYKIPQIEKISGITHAISTREEGNMSFMFDDEKIVKKRRLEFLSKIHIDYKNCISPYLKHETNILYVDDSQKGNGILDWRTSPHVDALITDKKNVHLFMLTADCLPVIIFDPRTNALGLIHAGWKGTEQLIVTNTIQAMVKQFRSNPNEMIAVIGPSIRAESYRFKDVVQKLPDRIPIWNNYLTSNTDGTTSIDLISFNIDQMVGCGIARSRIIDSGIDTAVDTRFFSHYRDSRTDEGDYGRFACVVGMI